MLARGRVGSAQMMMKLRRRRVQRDGRSKTVDGRRVLSARKRDQPQQVLRVGAARVRLQDRSIESLGVV